MPVPSVVRIVTRQSALALQQANQVMHGLLAMYPGLRVELLPVSTRGDEILDRSLAKIGGKGLFIKELEHHLLRREADIAVHSLKDVPAELPDGLLLACYCQGEDPRDALVSNFYRHLREVPEGARAGTSSLRRQSQLLALRPDLRVTSLRGNVHTRLGKLDDGEFDLIVLAAAGLQRLGLSARIGQFLDESRFVPAIGQGVIAIECREEDSAIRQLLAPLHHPQTAQRAHCERSFGAMLGGSCQLPVAGHARILGDTLHITGLVAMPDGSEVIRDTLHGPARQASELGEQLAENLLQMGAAAILQQVEGNPGH